MSVMRGLILNICQALQEIKTPLHLVQMPCLLVKRTKFKNDKYTIDTIMKRELFGTRRLSQTPQSNINLKNVKILIKE
jgi:hypothetical protein